MKLLILTQKVDKDDGVLGFFHAWIERFSKRFEKVTVICLEKGEYDLPANVRVLSLGKEAGLSKAKYIANFYKYIWQERAEYDTVFVHMNQEYVLMGWAVWRILRKKIFLWRNHPLGDHLTNVAVSFADKVFCTSPFAYTAQFKNAEVMPVGIDTSIFRPSGTVRSDSILFFGRVSPIKKPDILVRALASGKQKGIAFSADLVGPVPSVDEAYFESLKGSIATAGLHSAVRFLPTVPPSMTPLLLNAYKVYVNATPSGSMDKAIFEAMACETIVIVSNKALKRSIPDELIFEEGSSESLLERLEIASRMSEQEASDCGKMLRNYVVEHHDLAVLIDRLSAAFEA